jgi:hypothetical protein
MGGVKQRWLELESRNLSNIPDKNICIKHFDDDTAILETISRTDKYKIDLNILMLLLKI